MDLGSIEAERQTLKGVLKHTRESETNLRRELETAVRTQEEALARLTELAAMAHTIIENTRNAGLPERAVAYEVGSGQEPAAVSADVQDASEQPEGEPADKQLEAAF